MNIRGQLAFDEARELQDVVCRVRGVTSYDQLPEEIRQEVWEVIHGLIASVLATDDYLGVEESDFLNSWFGNEDDFEDNLEFVKGRLARWRQARDAVPTFVRWAIRNDLRHHSTETVEIIKRLHRIGIWASLADGNASDDELGEVVDYVNFLRSAAEEEGLLISEEDIYEHLENDLHEKSSTHTVNSVPRHSTEIHEGSNQGEPTETPPEPIEVLLDQLQNLVGLGTVKSEVASLVNLIKVRKMRVTKGMSAPPLSLHLVFTGNPGTGKTTVARLIAKIYRSLGLLSVGHLVETDRSGLVAGYVGQTAIKVREVVTAAAGGILFVDEAYSLAMSKTENDYGREAIDTLLKQMEDRRNDFAVIVAGYPNEMKQFLTSNPGLRSRFNKFIHFEDYGPQELYDIFVKFCSDSGYTFEEDCAHMAASLLQVQHELREEHFGNARMVRNFFEHAVANHANRVAHLSNPTVDDLRTFLSDDLPAAAAFR